MPFIIIGSERFALPIGDTPVGGTSDETLIIPQLARIPFAAVISVGADGSAGIRRTGTHPVRVDGVEVGDEPRQLYHGAKVTIAEIELAFGDIRENGSTAVVPGVREADPFASLGGLAQATPTSGNAGRLVARDGRVSRVPAEGLVIGREPTAGLVITGRGVSRYHATVAPTLRGYVVRDESENGVLVNGHRVDGEQVLGYGDILSIGDHELRFEDERAAVDTPAHRDVTPEERPDALPARAPRAPLAGVVARGPLLATLEVLTSGPLKGILFRIERPVAHIGRAEHNEVRLRDTSVSGSHATLTRRADGWILLDLGSTNGSYVDGARITGEQRLPSAAELRFGDLKLVFRPIAGAAADDESTRAVVGVRDPR